jgi:hypothetical protein
MQLNLEQANILDAEAVIEQADAVTVGWKFDTVETSACLEAWITVLRGLGFYVTKEVTECSIQGDASWLVPRSDNSRLEMLLTQPTLNRSPRNHLAYRCRLKQSLLKIHGEDAARWMCLSSKYSARVMRSRTP